MSTDHICSIHSDIQGTIAVGRDSESLKDTKKIYIYIYISYLSTLYILSCYKLRFYTNGFSLPLTTSRKKNQTRVYISSTATVLMPHDKLHTIVFSAMQNPLIQPSTPMFPSSQLSYFCLCSSQSLCFFFPIFITTCYLEITYRYLFIFFDTYLLNLIHAQQPFRNV